MRQEIDNQDSSPKIEKGETETIPLLHRSQANAYVLFGKKNETLTQGNSKSKNKKRKRIIHAKNNSNSNKKNKPPSFKNLKEEKFPATEPASTDFLKYKPLKPPRVVPPVPLFNSQSPSN